MKPGRRALGVAESYRGTDAATSTLAGAVVRANRRVDDFVFSTCTVGGSDATGAIVDAWDRLDRPDVQYVFLAGVALSWYNVADLETLHDATGRPVLSVGSEPSEGLSGAISEAFDGQRRRRRLAAYDALPDRRRIRVDGNDLFVRAVGIDDERAKEVVAAYTEAGRPEPIAVAKRAARRADAFRRSPAFQRD